MEFIIAAFDQEHNIVEEIATNDDDQASRLFMDLDVKYNKFPVGIYKLEDELRKTYKCWAQTPNWRGKKYKAPLEIKSCSCLGTIFKDRN